MEMSDRLDLRDWRLIFDILGVFFCCKFVPTADVREPFVAVAQFSEGSC